MPDPRIEVVNKLAHAAMQGMEQVAHGSSSSELISACFTLTTRTIAAILELHPASRPQIRHAIEQLLLNCVDTTQTN